jgi:hypothetical protein
MLPIKTFTEFINESSVDYDTKKFSANPNDRWTVEYDLPNSEKVNLKELTYEEVASLVRKVMNPTRMLEGDSALNKIIITRESK